MENFARKYFNNSLIIKVNVLKKTLKENNFYVNYAYRGNHVKKTNPVIYLKVV